MKPSDKIDAFPRLLAKLLVVFPQGDQGVLATELRAEAYYEALEEYEIDELAFAVRETIGEPGRVFLPSPGELKQVILEERRRRRHVERHAIEATREPTAEESATVKAMVDELARKARWA